MSDETTTEMLAEIEGQAADYTPPKGWRVLQPGEVIEAGDEIVQLDDGKRHPTYLVGCRVGAGQRYIRRIEPQAEPQPVQIREGRWRTRGGEVRKVTRTPYDLSDEGRYPWHDAEHCQTWHDNGRHFYEKESPFDLLDYLGPIEQPEPEPEPQATPDYAPPEGWRVLQEGEVLEEEDWIIDPRSGNGQPTLRVGRKVDHQTGEHQIYIRRIEPEPQPFITPDDVAAEALAGAWDQAQAEQEIAELQAQVAFLKNRELTLGTRLEEEKAVTTKRLQQVEELRNEVSYVQGLLGDERRRFAELETLTSDLRAVNATTEKAINSAARDKADLQHRLRAVAAEFGVQLETNHRLQTQLEAVKAELVQASKDRHLLQVELDAREQVSQAVSDRWEEGWDDGTARAVETIAEWLAPFQACGSQALALAVLQNLPHIMRSLTGLADTED